MTFETHEEYVAWLEAEAKIDHDAEAAALLERYRVLGTPMKDTQWEGPARWDAFQAQCDRMRPKGILAFIKLIEGGQ